MACWFENCVEMGELCCISIVAHSSLVSWVVYSILRSSCCATQSLHSGMMLLSVVSVACFLLTRGGMVGGVSHGFCCCGSYESSYGIVVFEVVFYQQGIGIMYV